MADYKTKYEMLLNAVNEIGSDPLKEIATVIKRTVDDEPKEPTEQKRASLRHVSTRLNDIALRSIAILDEIANDQEQTGASRIRAVEVALNYAYKGMEIEDLNNRLTEIENMLEQAEEGR